MNPIEKATILHYHRHRIATYDGGTVEALGWREQKSQSLRFEVLCTIGDLNGATILDVGCGYADFKGYLDTRFEGFTYFGIDHMPEFATAAKARYSGCLDTHIVQDDFTVAAFPEVDYVFASGALVYRSADTEFHTTMIAKMVRAARCAVGFNMLRVDRFPDHPLLIGHDLDDTIAYCQTLSGDVRVIDEYLDDDFTVFVYRTPGQDAQGTKK